MPALGSDVTSAGSVCADFMDSLCEINEMITSGRWIIISQDRSVNGLDDSLSRNVYFSLLIWMGIWVSTSGRSVLRGEGSCCIWWNHFLLEKTGDKEVEFLISIISQPTSVCLQGLNWLIGFELHASRMITCHNSVSCQFRWQFCNSFCTGVTDVLQREIICLWDVTRVPNTPVYRRRQEEYTLNPNVFPRKQCRTRWTHIKREHILSRTPWLSPHRLFLHQGKFSILLVSSRQQMPKQPQVRFYGTLHGKVVRKLLVCEVHRDADCLPVGGRGSFSRGKVVKRSQMHQTTASSPRIYVFFSCGRQQSKFLADVNKGSSTVSGEALLSSAAGLLRVC